MPRLRVVRHLEASASAVKLQQRHRVQEAPHGLEPTEALRCVARERGGQAHDREEQRRFNVNGVARGCEPRLLSSGFLLYKRRTRTPLPFHDDAVPILPCRLLALLT